MFEWFVDILRIIFGVYRRAEKRMAKQLEGGKATMLPVGKHVLVGNINSIDVPDEKRKYTIIKLNSQIGLISVGIYWEDFCDTSRNVIYEDGERVPLHEIISIPINGEVSKGYNVVKAIGYPQKASKIDKKAAERSEKNKPMEKKEFYPNRKNSINSTVQEEMEARKKTKRQQI